MFSYLAICIFSFSFCNAYPAENSAPDRININVFFDEFLPEIKSIIKQFRFDPMPLPDIPDDISRFGATLHLELTNGLMFGASNLTRNGNVSITFYDDLWRFKARVFMTELRCKFDYLASTAWGWYEEKGALNATVKNVTVNIGTDLSVPKFTIFNPKVHIENYSDITISRGSDSIVTIFTNLFVNLALPYFQEHIIKIAESTALQVANVTVKMVNDNVKRTINNIDQYVGTLLRNLTYDVMGNTKPQDVDKLLSPYINNAANFNPKDYPFRDIDKWTTAIWNETVLIWNETFGTQATSFRELDKWLTSLISPRPKGRKPTVPGKKPPNRQSVHPTKTTSPTKRPKYKLTTPSKKNPSKKPSNNDPLSNFDKILRDSWVDTFGNKSSADVLTDIFSQSWNETISDYQKSKKNKKKKKNPTTWDSWWASIGQRPSGK